MPHYNFGDIEKITDDDQLFAALDRIYVLMDAKPGTPEGDKLLKLVDMVEEYEDEFYAIGTIGEK